MKLNTKRTLIVGLAFMSISAFWQVYDSIVPLVLKNVFDLRDDIAGFIMALDNVLALFMLPIFGALSDKTNSRFGKRMPYIVLGTLAACVFAFLMPVAVSARNLVLYVITLGGALLSMATYRSPAVALMPDVTPKPLRSKANAIINLAGTVGGILMLGAIAVLAPKDGSNYFPLYIVLIVFMLICIGGLFAKVKEPQLAAIAEEEARAMGVKDEPETADGSGVKMSKQARISFAFMLASIFLWFMGYNAITTSFSKYANVYWGLQGGAFAYTLMIAQAAAIIAYIPVGIVSTKFGRKKTIMGGIVLLTIAFGSCVFFKTFGGLIFFFFILAGFGWAAIGVNSFPMVVEMCKGADVGKYTGYYYTASQSAQIITPIISGLVLEHGYKLLNSANPDAGYVLLFPYGAIFAAASFITMIFVRHGDSKAEAKKGLENFDIDD